MASTLADHLRALSDDDLGAFIRLRPDLVIPPPSDTSVLAARAQSRVSVARALDALDLFTLEILDGLRLVRRPDGTCSVHDLLALTNEANVDPAQVRTAVDKLRVRFLVYGEDSNLQLVRAIDELMSPYPAGLGRPAKELDPEAADLASDPAKLRRAVLAAPPEARAILDRLAAGPPVGVVQREKLRSAEDSPVRWLVEHQLLVSVDDEYVELPREVGMVLRRDTGPLGVLHPSPPRLDGPVRSGVDSAGAGQALEAVRHMEALLQELSISPATMLRSFGLGVRDLRRLSRDVGTSEQVTALLLEVAYACGLLSYTDPNGRGGDQQWLPSPAFDTWRTASLAHRWAVLARTWLDMTRAPALVGQRDEKDRPINVLSPGTLRVSAPTIRRAALSVLAEAGEGVAPGSDAVLERLAWQSPRRMGRSGVETSTRMLARAALEEAGALGVTGLEAMTTYGRILLSEVRRNPDDDPLGIRAGDEPRDPLVEALEALLPAPVDHVLVQADLTVVVPGPPEPSLAAELALVSDAESRGGATVYRVTPASVRRALDSGYAASDVHALFRRRSRTPVPQTLEYLIDDVARRHGGLRVGTAGAYLRSDDEALVGEVLADRRLAGLSLRRLAPTVLTTPYTTTRLLDALRDAGYAPVQEDSTGAVVVSRPKAARAPARSVPLARPDDFDPPPFTGPRLASIVEQLRLGDRLARAVSRSRLQQVPVDETGTPVTATESHTEALAVLRQAIRDRAKVWVGYVDAHGCASAKLVRPISMGGGYLRAEDERSETLHTFALHRITSARLDE